MGPLRLAITNKSRLELALKQWINLQYSLWNLEHDKYFLAIILVKLLAIWVE